MTSAVEVGRTKWGGETGRQRYTSDNRPRPVCQVFWRVPRRSPVVGLPSKFIMQTSEKPSVSVRDAKIFNLRRFGTLVKIQRHSLFPRGPYSMMTWNTDPEEDDGVKNKK